MQRNHLKESLRSPTITPPSLTSKQIGCLKKKPPAHKAKPSDATPQLRTTNQKAPTPKKRRNKSRTNSITPKTLKQSLYERVFHNNNLSDTDVSLKYLDFSRPNSKINKSLVNRLELTQKVKEMKKSAAPVIDQIIRKSLNKAKQRKLSQEKENKELELEKEIRRNELSVHNKQIRIQNSMKFKKKRAKGKPSHSKGRSESSSKVRNYAGPLIVEPEIRNKRSISIGDYYPSGLERRSDPSILDYIENKNQRRREENNFEALKKRAAEVTKAGRLKDLGEHTKFSKTKGSKFSPYLIEDYSSSGSEENEEVRVKRNISFIEDDDSNDSLNQSPLEFYAKNAEKIVRELKSDSDDEVNGRSHNIGQYSDAELSSDLRNHSAAIIQKHFRAHLIRKYLKSLNKNLEIQSQQAISTQALIKTKPLRISKPTPTLSIIPAKPTPLATQPQSSLSLPSRPKPLLSSPPTSTLSFCPSPKRLPLKISTQYTFTVFPDKNPPKDLSLLHSQLLEQISWNTAQTYIIEQLQNEEISSTKHDSEALKIQEKYKPIIYTLKTGLDPLSLDILENLSVEEYGLYERSKQYKQQMLQKVLMDAVEGGKKQELMLDLVKVECSEVGVQQSSERESEEEVEEEEKEERSGITHSKSLSQLHGDLSQGKYVSPSQQRDILQGSKFPMFFDLEDSIEVQSINLLANELVEDAARRNLPSLPSLPMLHLDLMQQELLYSEPRILTSSDSIVEYIKKISAQLNFDQILETLKSPLTKNPIDELFKLQEKAVGSPSDSKLLDFPLIINPDELIEQNSQDTEYETTMRLINKADAIHKKMLLAVFNILLQKFRPNSLEGMPLPWSEKSRELGKKLSREKVVDKVCNDIQLLSMFQAGRIFNEEIITSNGGIDDGLIVELREDRLERLIFYEIAQEEMEWVDYEFEETQVKLDLADMVLEELADEARVLLDA